MSPEPAFSLASLAFRVGRTTRSTSINAKPIPATGPLTAATTGLRMLMPIVSMRVVISV